MNKRLFGPRQGFTLIEIVLGIAISAIILGLVLFGFANYRQREILKVATAEVVSVLRQARSKTLVAEGDSAYGVHFDRDQVVLFAGSNYLSADPANEISVLPTEIGLATTSLGVNQVVFDRLSGQADSAGTLYVYWRSEVAASTTVIISEAGIISTP